MRAATIVFLALVDVLASVIVRLQFIAGHVTTAALITARQIVTYPLAVALATIRRALVDICNSEMPALLLWLATHRFHW